LEEKEEFIVCTNFWPSICLKSTYKSGRSKKSRGKGEGKEFHEESNWKI